MRLDGTRLDLRTIADQDDGGQPLIGGRRYIGVGIDMVIVSKLADAADAGIGIGVPDTWVSIRCVPRAYDGHVSPVDRDGWLDVAALTPWREYWMELSRVGGIQVERADSDGSRYRWYWPLPRDLWRGIQCG